MKCSILALLLTFTALFGQEATEITIDERTPISIVLSSNLHNRISITDGIVDSIVANPRYFRVDIHEKLGQAFLTILRPIETPQALSIVTASGLVQDFLVTAAEGDPTTIFLKETEEMEQLVFKESLADIETVSEIFRGKIPHGYRKRPFLPNDKIELGDLNEYIQHIEVFEGALENIYVVEIINNKRKTLNLEKDALKISEVNWIFSLQDELKKNGSTMLLISKRRD